MIQCDWCHLPAKKFWRWFPHKAGKQHYQAKCEHHFPKDVDVNGRPKEYNSTLVMVTEAEFLAAEILES